MATTTITTSTDSVKLDASGPPTTKRDGQLPKPIDIYGAPYFDNENGQTLPPLELYDHDERGKYADPTFSSLLKEGSTIKDVTKSIGAEVKGVQLSQLDGKGKDELALLVAQKKDFASLPIQEAVDFVSYFGRLHVHPVSGASKGFPAVHLVHRAPDDLTPQREFESKTTSISWHSDVSYEKQPPGTTFLYAIEVPEVGGDTIFVNQVKAYERLSPEFRERLSGLKVVHSAVEQAEAARKRGRKVRREPVSTVHPLVRTHPVTGEKALFVNPQFSRYIVGYKREESDNLLNFLYRHIALGQDFQCRVSWGPRSVVVWDNRVTAHSGMVDWDGALYRYIARLAPQAEVPAE
ncbi:sulfonate dioxygenase [Geosmithia morbida]|uniref:Sulfonate dioxygenase n=1 Tax=Geosmithia morbida TaxID=1094350 RepID=A0A9P4YWR1_9HYPO|nr:sulfonate dioxygenase [Geosmithia morbida]KAF4124508.1 sulfonate dioxygenase [Geosmithia morbida]